MIKYGEHLAVFERKVRDYSAHQCERALKDCHETLALLPNLSTDDPYYIKLWAEIDALRGRQLKIKKG